LAPTKQGTEEGDFGFGGGALIHATVRQVRKSDKCVHNPILHSHVPWGLNSRRSDSEAGGEDAMFRERASSTRRTDSDEKPSRSGLTRTSHQPPQFSLGGGALKPQWGALI
jgi:hypothetical protein